MNGELDGEKGDFHKAETAYRHAMNAKIYSHANHPDLHFNLHVMRVFQCNFADAFVELKLAIQFGDEQVSAREQARRLTQQIIQYHKSLTTHKGFFLVNRFFFCGNFERFEAMPKMAKKMYFF